MCVSQFAIYEVVDVSQVPAENVKPCKIVAKSNRKLRKRNGKYEYETEK